MHDSIKERIIRVILHDIRSVHNTGSVFRTGDAVGVDKIYLTGYTPAPKDRFLKDRSDFNKVSLGSEKTVEWEQEDILEVITKLKQEGFFVVCVEQNKDSLDYKNIPLHDKIVFIFGNEVDGVSQEIMSKCDAISEIKMNGVKESLNVSVTAGIILFDYRDRD